MNAKKFEKTFWNYYLELEREYLEIERIIPFDEINYNTFSYKYIDLICTICSEIDILFKEYMEIKGYEPDLDENGNPSYNINQYKKFVEEKVKNFKAQEIICYNRKFYNKTIYPYKNWKNEPPKWWTVYNKIKHNQEQLIDNKKAYKYANQICVLNALGALFQLNLYIYENIQKNGLIVPLPESLLFKLERNWEDPYKYIINGKDSSKAANDLINEMLNRLSKELSN